MRADCPHCGADVGNRSINTFINCESCKNLLFISHDRLCFVYTHGIRIDAQQLESYFSKYPAKNGGAEDVEILSNVLLYLPFWGTKGNKVWFRGSYRFPEETMEAISGTGVFFSPGEIEKQGVEIVDVDITPGHNPDELKVRKPSHLYRGHPAEQMILYYLPFFKISIRFGEMQYYYFLNAVNGKVTGAPSSFQSMNKRFKLLPLFIIAFFLFLLNNFLIGPILVVMSLNVLLLIVSYSVAKRLLEKEIFSDTG